MTQDRTALPLPMIISEAIGHEMERDETILAIGEDIGRAGGVFGATRGLQDRFGKGRVVDAPIAEMAFTGMGVGLAQAGMRPLIEIMFVDFIGVCFEQVYNAAGKIPYMSGGLQKMPIVFKTAGGWKTIPEEDEWHTITWDIPDPCFVNYWGYNFRLESDGNEFNQYFLRRIKVEKTAAKTGE